jgi:hypothetical protein
VTGAGPARSVQRTTVRVGQNVSLNLTLNEQPLVAASRRQSSRDRVFAEDKTRRACLQRPRRTAATKRVSPIGCGAFDP